MKNKTLFKTIVGSHVWNMNTPLSDTDVFECYIAPTYDILTGKQHNYSHFSQSCGIDNTSTEIGVVVKQLLKNNINYLVYVFSPNVICGKETLKSIKYPAFNNISKITYNSIHGMALSNYKKYILTNKSNTLKKLNTIARTLQFGITLFDKEILEFKTTNITTSQEIEELFKEMDIAHANSNLPEKPHAPEMLEDWLYDTRILELE